MLIQHKMVSLHKSQLERADTLMLKIRRFCFPRALKDSSKTDIFTVLLKCVMKLGKHRITFINTYFIENVMIICQF